MLKASFLLGCLVWFCAANAQSLQEQIAAVGAVQDLEEARRMDWLRTQQMQQERAAAQQRAAQTLREHSRAAAAQAAYDEALASKKRDQQYEDRLRELAIRQKEIELRRLDARARREDEFIDRDLAQQRAATDVVQSEADVNRNLSSGAKVFLEESGTNSWATQVEINEPAFSTRPAGASGGLHSR